MRQALEMLYLYDIIKLNNSKLKYIYINILLILIFSIIYWILGTPDNLTFPEGYANESKNISYISALYFTCVTHSTVGFGDVLPKSKLLQCINTIQTIILILNLSILIL